MFIYTYEVILSYIRNTAPRTSHRTDAVTIHCATVFFMDQRIISYFYCIQIIYFTCLVCYPAYIHVLVWAEHSCSTHLPCIRAAWWSTAQVVPVHCLVLFAWWSTAQVVQWSMRCKRKNYFDNGIVFQDQTSWSHEISLSWWPLTDLESLNCTILLSLVKVTGEFRRIYCIFFIDLLGLRWARKTHLCHFLFVATTKTLHQLTIKSFYWGTGNK